MNHAEDRKRDTFGLRASEGMACGGAYDIPLLQPVTGVEVGRLLSFGEVMALYRKGADLSDAWFHFFVDDFRYEAFWKHPERYLPALAACKGGFGLDFSMLIDMPRSVQLYNCWRNAVLTRWLQDRGIVVVPNAGFSDERSWAWAFDALPERSDLCVTTQGCMKDRLCKYALVNGLHELDRRKRPARLFVYGLFPDVWRDRFSFEVVRFDTFAAAKWGR